MVKDGVELFVEVGPGKVFSGLVRKIKKEARVYNIENTETLKKFKNEAKDADHLGNTTFGIRAPQASEMADVNSRTVRTSFPVR
jgi:hypothetical protein